MKKINILGINISDASKEEILMKIYSFLEDSKTRYVVTPNPEIILNAHKDEELFYILNHADLSITDGTGIKFAGLFMNKNLKRFTGSDLTKDLLNYSEKKKYKVCILNWRGGLSSEEDIKKSLQKKYPNLKFLVQDIDREGTLINFKKINNFSPDILFSTLGNPWQEKNIYHSKDKIKNLKLALAVGGSLDFITGKSLRAPLLFRKIGLEWFWRLLRQPKRIRRIYNATFVFMYNFLIWQFIHPLLYRPNVACMLFKNTSKGIKIFIVKRNGEDNHWQLPQGGTDGESLKKAGSRELREEAGTTKFRSVRTFKNLHKYLFDPKYTSKFNIHANKVEGYKGQKQGLYIAEFIGVDNDIKINYWEHSDWKWVDLKDFVEALHEVRKKAAKIYLKKLKKTFDIA